MRKYLLFVLIIFITGCSINCDINIKNDSFTENDNLTIQTGLNTDYINEHVSNSNRIYDNYKVDYKYSTEQKGLDSIHSYNFKFNFAQFKKFSYINRCFEKVEIDNDDDYISIKTSDRFQCIYMDEFITVDEVKVNITTDLKVVSNNADVVDGNKYSWTYDLDNIDKPINIKIKKSNKLINSTLNFIEDQKLIYVIIVIIVLIIFGFIIFKFIRNKNEKNNEI